MSLNQTSIIPEAMYLLSVEGLAAQTVLKSFTKLPSQWMTVYRWGMFWGYWNPSSSQWTAERHQYSTHHRDEFGNTFLLEAIEPSSIAAPPYDIDDVWKEEIKQDGVCTYGNLLTIRGSKSTIEDILAKLSISFSLPSSTEDREQTNSLLPASEIPRLPSPPLSEHPARKERRHQHSGGVRPGPPAGRRDKLGNVKPPQLPSSSPDPKSYRSGRRPQSGGQDLGGKHL
jgi:hypothetical protein